MFGHLNNHNKPMFGHPNKNHLHNWLIRKDPPQVPGKPQVQCLSGSSSPATGAIFGWSEVEVNSPCLPTPYIQ